MASSSHPEINFDSLYDMAAGNTDVVRNLLTVVHKNLKEVPSQLQQLYSKQNYLELREAAHKFKSSIAYLDFDRFTETLVSIETSEQEQLEITEIGRLVKEVVMYAAETQKVVQNELQRIS